MRVIFGFVASSGKWALADAHISNQATSAGIQAGACDFRLPRSTKLNSTKLPLEPPSPSTCRPKLVSTTSRPTMDLLPQELIDRIAYFIEAPLSSDTYELKNERRRILPPLATISRRWKAAIENITFSTLSIQTTDLGELRTVMKGSRRRVLAKLEVRPILPGYAARKAGHRETRAERSQNDKFFSRKIVEVLDILKMWEDDGVLGASSPPRLELSFREAQSPSDVGLNRNWIIEDGEWRRKRIDSRWQGHFLNLVIKSDEMPVLRCVRELRIERSYGRRFAPRFAAELVSRMPSLECIWFNLEEAALDLEGAARVDIHERCAQRWRFAEILASATWPALDDVYIKFSASELLVATCNATASLLPPSATFDPFSASLRVLSYNLTNMDLSGTFDATLFWPLEEELVVDPSATAWPNMKSFCIRFDMVAPNGEWYFPGALVPTLDVFNKHWVECKGPPHDERLVPLLVAFAKALMKMPKLTFAYLACPLKDAKGFYYHFNIAYYSPGGEAIGAIEGIDDTSARRVYYEVGEWRPSAELERLLGEVGATEHGGVVSQKFLANQFAVEDGSEGEDDAEMESEGVSEYDDSSGEGNGSDNSIDNSDIEEIQIRGNWH